MQDMLKNLFFKFFSKEKISAYIVGAVLAASAAALNADSDAVKKMFCEPPQQVEQSK